MRFMLKYLTEPNSKELDISPSESEKKKRGSGGVEIWSDHRLIAVLRVQSWGTGRMDALTGG